MTVAVVGAGMAGAAAASTLRAMGFSVEVFDKSRAVGGRMSSKRQEHGYLDLGAQYFTARTPLFKQQVEQWLATEVVTCWPADCYKYELGRLTASADTTSRFIGNPSMHTPVKALLAGQSVHLNCRISRLRFVSSGLQTQTEAAGWYLFDQHNNSFGPYQALILTLPPVQLQTLLATTFMPAEPGYSDIHQLITQLQPQVLLPCWAVSLQLAAPIATAADAIFVKEGNLSWLARQNSKPGRVNKADNWLVHFSAQSTAVHLRAEPQELVALAKAEMELIFQQTFTVSNATTHRWLYAQINPAVSQIKPDYHAGLKLAFAGDWMLGGRVENAYLSGVAAAREVSADV
ncbi:NAD(P)/FAD-dependent oxidoreductase [Arsukibacterium indicum]|uniref:FAD-dependent oxidoreductase n=1 Tax=Arsukibacterium indicum TaxID=2848612 RepID=A0ABS6MKS9_9GAMM|nr:FAD-dependent oxidoreductase [Arsukibacterium indicum]MBV2128837.1 FAD-dependent oxidoreductase [Arsukibacterium indicum]